MSWILEYYWPNDLDHRTLEGKGCGHVDIDPSTAALAMSAPCADIETTPAEATIATAASIAAIDADPNASAIVEVEPATATIEVEVC